MQIVPHYLSPYCDERMRIPSTRVLTRGLEREVSNEKKLDREWIPNSRFMSRTCKQNRGHKPLFNSLSFRSPRLAQKPYSLLIRKELILRAQFLYVSMPRIIFLGLAGQAPSSAR